MLHHKKYLIAILAIFLAQPAFCAGGRRIDPLTGCYWCIGDCFKDIQSLWRLLTRTPLQKACDEDDHQMFKASLMENECEPLSFSLIKQAIKTGDSKFIKTIIASQKLSPKTSFEKIFEHILTKEYHANPSYFHGLYLLALASATEKSFQKKIDADARKNDSYRIQYTDLEKMFICPAYSQEFSDFAHKKTMSDFSKLDQRIFENALIVRNTTSITTLLHKLLQNRENETAQTLLASLEEACEEHAKIWPPYAYEIKDIITKLKNSYQKQYFSLLSQPKLRNIYFNFKAT